MSGDLSDYINIEHRGDCSVLLIRETEYVIGHNISFREDSYDPRDVVTRWQLSMILYHIPPPPPPDPKRRSRLDLGLRRPQR